MYRVSNKFVAHMIRTFEGEGLNAHSLCQQVGIDPALLRKPEHFVSRTQAYRLMNLAQEQSLNSNLGLRAYRYFQPGDLQLVGYTMMSSPNLKVALEALIRYLPLLSSGICAGMTEEQGHYRFWLNEEHDDIAKPRAIDDFGAVSMLGFCRWITGGSLPNLQEVSFPYPAPDDPSEHRYMFGCDVLFNQPCLSFVFTQQALLQPLSTANEALALLHGRLADEHLKQLLETAISVRTRAWLIEHLSRCDHDLEAVSSNLKMTPRALQRGLALEGTSFSHVLDEVRQTLAGYYLRNSSSSLIQISETLGFKESSSFNKACLRWFQMSPGRYRKLHKTRS